MRRQAVLFCLILLCLSSDALAQQTIVAAARSIDWSAAGTSVPNRTAICTTLNPGAAASQINAAIAGCPSGQVVKLNAGTYNLTSGIVFNGKSNVTLRGAGPNQTFLVFSASVDCFMKADICITDGNGNDPTNPGHSANWTGGYNKGTTSITLSSTTGLAVGQVMMLDQLNDTNTDTGNIWQCSTMDVCSSEGDASVRRSNRSQVQSVVVTGISGSTVTFTPGLYMPNWRSSQSPGAWWSANQPIHDFGIEDLSLDHSSSDQVAGILLTAARNWWVKNIRSINANRAAIWVYGSTKGTIRDSYFYGTQFAESQSYGVETDLTSDILVENNIFEHIAAAAPTGEATTGSVYGYNYSLDDYYLSSGNTQWMQASSYHHSSGINFTLFEGNDGIGFTADQIHGTSHFMTAFRNYWVGWDPAGGSVGGKTQQTIAVHLYSFNRYFNVIGNVLGKSGYHTNYEGGPASATTPGPDAQSDRSVYMLGWSGNEAKYPTMPNDLLVRSTLMRWGNYDTVSAAARYQASEVPSGIGLYSNPVPASQSLPASFYLGARPSWWGSGPWPAIGPDVTGGSVPSVAGHAYKIPARQCYESTAKINGILDFNAYNCYSTSGAIPSRPTNLRIVR